MAADIAAAKRQLRALMLERRRSCPPGQRAAASEAMAKRLLAQAFFREARVVMAYASLPDEVQLYGLLRTCRALGKRLLLPRLSRTAAGKAMAAVPLADDVPISPETLGIWHEGGAGEPDFPPEAIDCILVPGTAFTPQGGRMGMGGGYYDAFLPQAKNAYRAALAYEFQLLDELPLAAHDAGVDAILTEKRMIVCRNER